MTDLNFSLTGKRAVVSGSSRGVGFAVAEALARAGANVAINYLANDKTAQAALCSLKGINPSSILVKADVSVPEGAGKLISEAEEAFGGVDILINNAHGRIIRNMFQESAWEDHQAHLDGILRPAFYLSKRVIDGMKSGGWGRIVNIGNNMLFQPVKGYSALTSAMGGVLGFTRNLAAEAGPWGITVNMVSPGFVLTEEAPHTNESVRQAIKESTPLGRLAQPQDVAGVVLFFCSEAGRFVTGANLSVDGGRVMG
ncbi:MAG: SDR family NAD(P)-dependent oxidoreductase [Nitrospirota bacterium]